MKRILRTFLALALSISALSGASSAEPAHPIFKGQDAKSLCVLKEQREERYHHLLRVSVKVAVPGSAGSGTICHYDPSTGWAYVVSCGHLWEGNKAYDSKGQTKAKVIVWYKDGQRLESPAVYDAEALFWSNSRGKDVSALRFKPDWSPSCAPIDRNFVPEEGRRLNSMGCDGGREVARYEVVIKYHNGTDIETRLNSPRPGRSGGGLLTDDCRLVGVCWGTSDTSSGDGDGFFTPVPAIKEVFGANEHSWLVETAFGTNEIPIFDHDDPRRSYDRHFVPMPGF